MKYCQINFDPTPYLCSPICSVAHGRMRISYKNITAWNSVPFDSKSSKQFWLHIKIQNTDILLHSILVPYESICVALFPFSFAAGQYNHKLLHYTNKNGPSDTVTVVLCDSAKEDEQPLRGSGHRGFHYRTQSSLRKEEYLLAEELSFARERCVALEYLRYRRILLKGTNVH